jgi:hypothetical protein
VTAHQFVSAYVWGPTRRETWRCPDPGRADFTVDVTHDRVELTAATFNELSRVDPPYSTGMDDEATVFLPYAMFAAQMDHWGWTLIVEEAPLV